MSVYYVQLNDIFDEKKSMVMEQRVQNAFGTDGTDFWKNFFFCDTYHADHPDEKVIYLFTEYQLWFLWKWWHNKYNASSEDTQLKLDYSKQKLFNTLQDGSEFKEIFACYIMKTSGRVPKRLCLRRARFGLQPTRYLSLRNMKRVDFFDGRFNGEPPSKPADENEYMKKLVDVDLRKVIANEFGRIEYKNPDGTFNQWLHYLIPRHIDKHIFIEYCANEHPNCPLVQRIAAADNAV